METEESDEPPDSSSRFVPLSYLRISDRAEVVKQSISSTKRRCSKTFYDT